MQCRCSKFKFEFLTNSKQSYKFIKFILSGAQKWENYCPDGPLFCIFRMVLEYFWCTYSQVPILRTGPIIRTVWFFSDWINYKYWTISIKIHCTVFFTTIPLFLLYVPVGKFLSFTNIRTGWSVGYDIIGRKFLKKGRW